MKIGYNKKFTLSSEEKVSSPMSSGVQGSESQSSPSKKEK